MKKYTKEVISSLMKQYYQKYNKIPSSEQWKKVIQKPSLVTIERMYGCWSKAIQEVFNVDVSPKGIPKQKRLCGVCKKETFRKIRDIKNSKSGLVFCSHKCAATYSNTHKTKGNRRSKLEIYIEKQLKNLYPNLEIHFNQKNAIDSELDIYIPSLKLAFELNGIFHFEPIFGQNKLEQIQANDNNKFQKCQEKGISLCIIDTSQQKYFKPATSQKYLDVIISTIKISKMVPPTLIG